MSLRACRAIAFVLVSAVELFGSSAAHAQPAAGSAKVAILNPFSPPEPGTQTFRRELRRLGWIEGRNLDLDIAWVNGQLDRLPNAAAELVRHHPDVIFAPGEQGLAAAKQASAETPIVTVACDPLDRLIVSLAAPGGSATGLSCVHSELAAKRLDILREFVPGLTRVAVLYNAQDQGKGLEFKQLEARSTQLGLAVRGFGVTDARGIEDAFAGMEAMQAQAVMVLVDALAIFHRQRIVDLALERRLPSIFGFKEFAEAGGLVSYGASRGALFARAASYVDKILKGAKPGELPVEEPAIFELYINQKTATALGLTVPSTLLTLADEVIE